MEGPSDFCKPEDFEYFLQQRHLLTQNAVDGILLRSKPVDSTVGLVNHGSTCYLNSVVQCLVQNASFLKAVFTTNDANDHPIVKELKKLVTFLVHSIRNAVGTKDLLASFGWNQSQVHDQHDAQEFYSILLDALSQASPLLEGKLHETFRGSDADVIQCTECQYEKTTDSFYQHLSVEVPDHLEGKPSSENVTHALGNLLTDSLKAEVLDENNKWECSSCNRKVCANRLHQYKSLPEIVTIQLKRFRFDPTSKKRRKLNTAIEFQDQYNFNELLQPSSSSLDDNSGVYQLTGIICHLGTAMGGHYKSYVRSMKDMNTWWECNDENIHKCTEEEIQTLFLSSGNNADQPRQQQSSIMENAYVLFYTRLPSVTAASSEYTSMISSLIPSTKEIEDDNESYRTLMRLSAIQRSISHMDVSIYRVNEITPLTNTTLIPFYFPKQTTVQAATQQIYSQLTSQGILSESEYPLTNVRIRKFSNTRNSKGETFDSREQATLAEIGLLDKEQICFEIRRSDDPVFVEYNPNEMLLSLYLWDSGTTPLEEVEAFIQAELQTKETDPTATTSNSKWLEVIVPGREKATVSNLHATIREKFGISESQTFATVPFIQNSNIPLSLVDDANAELRKKYQIFPATKLFVELIANPAESKILNLLKSLRSRLRLSFNNPKVVNEGEGGEVEYNHEIETTSDITLQQLKQLIQEKLQLTEEFYCKQNKDGIQFKEENKTLQELSITDQSIIHVQLGKGCKPGEHFLRFELDIGRIVTDPSQNRYILLTEVPVNEKSNILSLKKLLFTQWEDLLKTFHTKIEQQPNANELITGLSNLLLNPPSLHHIRLRDFKNGKISGPLRDDRLLCRCLLGLSDGRRIILQILPNEEIIGSDDLLITIRTVFYYYSKNLSEPYDISIPRSFTIKNLYEKLMTYFPQMINLPNEDYDIGNNIMNSTIQRHENNFIEFAKGYTTGPPITLKSSLKLKWDFDKTNIYNTSPNTTETTAGETTTTTATTTTAASVSIGDTVIDRPPLNLRDGSVLILRNKYDFLKAQEASQQKQKEKLESESENVIGVGGGISAVRAKSLNSSQRRPGSSARFNRPGSSASNRSMRGSSTEPVLKIVTHDKNSRPPLPGEGKGAGIAAGGSPNENIMNTNTLPESPQKEMI